MPAGAGVAATTESVASTASISPFRHGGGQWACDRSSRTSSGRSPSRQPTSSGRNGAETAAYTRCSSRSHPAARSSSAAFTKTQRPSSSSTRQSAVFFAYPPPATRSHRTGAAPSAAATSARGKLLGKLDAISVGVVDVEQPHLAVQLEDDADLDSRRPKPLRLRLHVLDVDVRDAAVLLRLALREADLHLASAELRPAALGVEVGLREAEDVAVEPAGHVSGPHVAPDSRLSPPS